MQINPEAIPELLLLLSQVHGYEGRFFVEASRLSGFKKAGIPEVGRHNQSCSREGVLRDLRYQLMQPEGKQVRIARVAVLDVAQDVQRSSLSFGQVVSTILDDIQQHRSWYRQTMPLAS